MLLNDYLTDINHTIADFAQTGLIVSSDVKADFRTEKAGLLTGVIDFIDSSTLFFKEYLDLRYRVDKKMYSFHYQNAKAILCFRYDNANHRPHLGFSSHKHTSGGTVFSEVPNLQDVLDEIVNTYLYEQ